MRSKERLSVIDNYLTEHYPSEGSKMCSEALSENIGYIQSRVQRLGLIINSSRNTKTRIKTSSSVRILEGKVFAKNREIEKLWDLLKEQRKINSELRSENIKLITEKVKYKKQHTINV